MTTPLPTPNGTGHFTAVSPPTRPGVVAGPPKPTVWPIVFGVAGMVLGIAGILGGIMGLFMPLFMKGLQPRGPNGEVDGGIFLGPNGEVPLDTFGAATPLATTYYLVSIMLSILLTVAAIKVVKRQPFSHRWMVRWAIIKLAHAVFAVYFTLEFQRTNMQSQSVMWGPPGSTQPPANVISVISTGVLWFTGVLTAVWCIWAPITVLAWFARSKVRAEVATWAQPTAASQPRATTSPSPGSTMSSPGTPT